MCLITNQKEPIVLQKELIVYKKIVVEQGNIYSIFYPFKWELGKKYQTEIQFGSSLNFFYAEVINRYLNFFKNQGYIFISLGFHSYVNITSCKEMKTFSNLCIKIAKCYIPEGAEVYYGINNDIVSDYLIIEEILE